MAVQRCTASFAPNDPTKVCSSFVRRKTLLFIIIIGRGYWTCNNRAESCKFWQWDESTPGVSPEASTVGTLPANHQITQADVAFLRGSGVAMYCDAVVLKVVSSANNRRQVRAIRSMMIDC